jgi:hypothetical protein
MNIQATHSFTIGVPPKPDGDRVTKMVTEGSALAPVLARPREKQLALAVVMLSSVDGSRVARDKLTQWHWSGAVFCPAC